MEFRFPVYLPVTPMTGDPVEIDGKNTTVTGEFARLVSDPNHFFVQTADGRLCEVVATNPGNGRRGSQRWLSVRDISRPEFLAEPRSPAL